MVDASFGNAAIHRKGFDSSGLGSQLNRSRIRHYDPCSWPRGEMTDWSRHLKAIRRRSLDCEFRSPQVLKET
jgi:hypothetical protein